MVLATKFTFPYPTGVANPNSSGSHRKSLRHSLEGSLRRLDTDYVDLLWVHAWDQCTPAEETMRALDDLVRAGKVLAIGVSNTPAWVAAQAQAIAELRGWTAFCSMQVEYSLAERSADRELVPMARTLGLASMAWSPLGRGAFGGKHDPEKLSPAQRRALEAVTPVAKELGVTPAQVALAWVLRQGFMPVLGARRIDQIRDNLAVVDVRIDDAHLASARRRDRDRTGVSLRLAGRESPPPLVLPRRAGRVKSREDGVGPSDGGAVSSNLYGADGARNRLASLVPIGDPRPVQGSGPTPAR